MGEYPYYQEGILLISISNFPDTIGRIGIHLGKPLLYG